MFKVKHLICCNTVSDQIKSTSYRVKTLIRNTVITQTSHNLNITGQFLHVSGERPRAFDNVLCFKMMADKTVFIFRLLKSEI